MLKPTSIQLLYAINKLMRKMKLVCVGNGMAGVRTLEELIKIAPDLYEITVSVHSLPRTTTLSCPRLWLPVK